MKKIKKTTGKAIPLTNLSYQYQNIEQHIQKALKRALTSGRYILSTEVENFEKKLAHYIGTKFAVGLASGTDALTLALKALNLGQGDGVIIPANVYPTVFGVALSGVKIQLSDVDSETLNIDLESIEKAYDSTTKVIVVVHLYGNPVDLEPILKFAKKKRLIVIEDCAQAFGAKYKGRKVGSFGHVSCFSFYPTKNLGAYGDGGAVLTDDPRLYKKVKRLRMYGEADRYKSTLIGHNSRLDELQAAILNTKLKYIDGWNRRRRFLSKIYLQKLNNLPIKIVQQTQNGTPVYHLFVVKIKKRNKLVSFLNKQRIITGVHYPVPIHLTNSFKYLGYKKGDFPISERASQEVLSLPMFPELSEESVKLINNSIGDFFKIT